MASKLTASQPPMANTMDMYYSGNEKHVEGQHQHQHECDFEHELESRSPCHKRCHGARLTSFLLPILLTFLGLVAVLGLSCYFNVGIDDVAQGIFSRAVDGTTGASNGNGAFVDNKLYLIVIFVGLVVVVILGICLSAWCCRGAFQNPLCCPCYLCACCGGLACLECIGCGLCAEGAQQF